MNAPHCSTVHKLPVFLFLLQRLFWCGGVSEVDVCMHTGRHAHMHNTQHFSNTLFGVPGDTGLHV